MLGQNNVFFHPHYKAFVCLCGELFPVLFVVVPMGTRVELDMWPIFMMCAATLAGESGLPGPTKISMKTSWGALKKFLTTQIQPPLGIGNQDEQIACH